MDAASAGVVLTYVVSKLGDLLLTDGALLMSVRSDIEWLERELRRMHSFLQDAGTKQQSDSRIRNWIRDVRLLAYRAEDIIDTFLVHFPEQNLPNKSIFSCLSPHVQVRYEVGEEIKCIREMVEEVSRSRVVYGIENPEAASGYVAEDVALQARRRIAPYAEEDADVVGLEDDVIAVTDMLLEQESRRSVVSIVGMGGVGKTTLAKKVYNGVGLSRFDCSAWVDVSQKYSSSELLKSIGRKLTVLSLEDVQRTTNDEIGEKIHRNLKEKRYLIVLDDVWETELWDLMKNHLPDSKNGSRVIITTRSMVVARWANPSVPPYELPFLDEEESWALFTKKAYPNQEPQLRSGELVRLGRQIVKKCGGLPLALVVLGGLLSIRDKTPTEWLKVVERINWQQTDEGSRCLAILALSYNDLPFHLKWCFLYLSSFPEDHEIDSEKLVRLWIAEGFVANVEAETMEETAERYLEELAQRCLIQVTRRTTYGSAVTCRVHDVLLDFAVCEANNASFFDVWRSAEHASSTVIRRLAIHREAAQINAHMPTGSTNIRTLMLSSSFNRSSLDLKNLKLLRVLDLHKCTDCLPHEIGSLVNLRHLGLTNNLNLVCIPHSANRLRRLQTLDLRWTSVTQLPEFMWSISTLRHVLGELLTIPKSHTKYMISKELRTLASVTAGRWIQTNLANLTNLTKLKIDKIQGDGSYAKILSTSLEKLQRLNVLRLLLWEDSVPRVGTILDIDELFKFGHQHLHALELHGTLGKSLECTRLPQNLTEVTLKHTGIGRNIIEMLGSLQFLKTLALLTRSYVGEEMGCQSGWFPQLQDLSLQGLEIKRWMLEENSMVFLRNLNIESCAHLEMLPEGLRYLKVLRVLNLRYMTQRFLQRAKVRGEDWPKIQHVEFVNYIN